MPIERGCAQRVILVNVMTMPPLVFGWAMAAYLLSFALAAAMSEGGVAVPGYYCAFATFAIPFSMNSRFFEAKVVEHIALLISGWINIAFLASLAIRWRSGDGPAFRVLRTTTFLMIPFCWIVFYDQGVFPREGHVLWIVGMAFALFSESSSSTAGLGSTHSSIMK